MADRISVCGGCMLGMAVGDAMGYTVDGRSWQEIQEDYGPNGLLGYDLVNGCAEVSSYTQMGAYAANGLLLGVTRGRPELYIKYLQVSMKEWAQRQDLPRDPGKYTCWVSHVPSLRRRHCRDSWMLDALRNLNPGTTESPINRSANPGAMMAAAMVGLACDPSRMPEGQVTQLGAAAVATTHGAPEAFLSGAVLAGILAGIVKYPKRDLRIQFEDAIDSMLTQFTLKYSQADQVADRLKKAMQMPQDAPQEVMESLICDRADQCLGAAMYACLTCGEDFDTAMILAVNHSGKSAAVGAMTGAILGAKLGVEALPEFYLESLEVVDVLTELSRDVAQGNLTLGLFDDDWDHKYTQGMPINKF